MYILDEPEAALSPLRQISMLARINELVQQGSQFIISTHSPIIMAYPDAKILQISDEGMSEVALEESNHYLLMKQFLKIKIGCFIICFNEILASPTKTPSALRIRGFHFFGIGC